MRTLQNELFARLQQKLKDTEEAYRNLPWYNPFLWKRRARLEGQIMLLRSQNSLLRHECAHPDVESDVEYTRLLREEFSPRNSDHYSVLALYGLENVHVGS